MKSYSQKIEQHFTVICFLFSLICCLGLFISRPAHTDNSVAEEIISLDATGQPLGEVLDDISEATGYQFSIDESWEEFPINASFKNEPLHKGLKIILRNLNNAVIYGSDRKIKIIIYEAEAVSGTPAGHSIEIKPSEETILQPRVHSNPSFLPPRKKVFEQNRSDETDEQSSEEDAESRSESDETTLESKKQNESEPEEDAEENTEDSEPEQKENASEEDDDQTEETESVFKNPENPEDMDSSEKTSLD
ncbi:MAG: hypothetical protein JSV31_19795 [Desulfobacterales bacterium]|nr:MAG: hypothetical protein JSV31_19795 [Desulfobacterales bacterium]